LSGTLDSRNRPRAVRTALAALVALAGGLVPAVAGASFWMPAQGSQGAGGVDSIFYLILWIALAFFALIVGLMVFFVLRYRRRPGAEAEGSATHNLPLEIVWTLVPTAIVALIFVVSFRKFLDLTTPPANAYEIQVTGQKWKWLFTYPSGYVDENLHVPIDRPVTLTMTSQDVIHSLFIPDFRIKKDVVPGRYSKLWFRATVAGEHQIFCTQYCGTGHSDMLAKVIVHPAGDFEKWLAANADLLAKLPPSEAGEKLYSQRGCRQCHSVDGSPMVGPSFKGIFGHPVALQDGRQVMVDENYVRESILDPQAKVVAGYQPVMPTFRGRLTDKEITALIEYLKTLAK
jgi:cytochrome c oxidase subunit II